MAGTVTLTTQKFVNKGDRPVMKHTIAWTSDAAGDATGTVGPISGAILRVVTIPSATAAPTDNYDVTLTDDNGMDILAGQGANRDTANAEHFKPGLAFTDGTTTSVDVITIDDELDLVVAAAGDTKSGQVVIYTR